MKTIQKLQKPRRRDLKNGFFMAFSLPGMEVMEITAIIKFIKLPDFISLILREKSIEAHHQLAFLLA